MDAVSLGWSRMGFRAGEGAYLNVTSAENNEYHVPQGYEDIADKVILMAHDFMRFGQSAMKIRV